MFSSKSSEYSTPQELFNALNCIFRFDLDPASTHENAKCEKHFTKEEDGLKQSWEGHSVFCNPPYGIRLDADNQLYQELFNAVHRLKGWRIAILAGSPKCVAGIKLQPVETHPLKNGAIDCRLLVYEV